MTRVNVVPVHTLSRQHLIAEWREIPRIFPLAHKAATSGRDWRAKQPSGYVLGTGHMMFFYDKLKYLDKRHRDLTQEMLRRGYQPSYLGHAAFEWRGKIPTEYWQDYVPTDEAIIINSQRIRERS